MKLVFFEAKEGDEEKLKEADLGVDVEVVEEMAQDSADSAADAEIVSVFVQSKLDKEQLDKMPKLKLIATRSTGFDHVDLEECKKRDITVANVPIYGENTVAEHAFALILALSRKVFQSYERTEKMDFDREGLEGFDLKGKTLGVVGCGSIGRHSVKMGRGFDMEVVVYDLKADAEFAKETGCSFVDNLDDLLKKSDVITIHVPYIPDATHHLINKENVKLIKKGAILVNTARGAIVDTEALLWGLENGILSGVGLDVLEEENQTFDHVELLSSGFPKDQDIATLLRNHILVARDDVIITPHNAFNSKEAKERIFAVTVENIKGWQGKKLINVVKS